MRNIRFPRYPTHDPLAGWSPDLDWSRIDQRRRARDRADRICGRLMYLVLPTLLAALVVFACVRTSEATALILSRAIP